MYKRIEADAVVAGLTDADFGNTDREGFVVGAGYQLLEHLTLKATFYATELLETPAAQGEDDFTKLQLDAIAKF